MTDLLDTFAALVASKITANLRNLPAQTSVKLYTISQVAEMLNRSKSSVQHLIAKGDLPAVRIGRRVQVEKDELERWIEQNRETR